MSVNKLLIGVALLALIGVGGAYLWSMNGSAGQPSAGQPSAGQPSATQQADSGAEATIDLAKPIDDPLAKVQEGDILLGDPDAPVTMIEYFSYSCGHCANFHAQTFPELKKTYIDTGKVKLVMRDFPLNRPALEAALMIHCLSPMAYWGMTEHLFKTQEQWVVEQSLPPLGAIAKTAGLDDAAFQACVGDTAKRDGVIAGAEAGTKAFGIDSTPTFVIDGIVVKGDRSFATFQKILDGQLAVPH